MVKIRQQFEDNSIEDIEGHVRAQLEKAGIGKLVKPGQKVALTLGSRNISNISRVIKATIDTLKECKADPYIVLGMGSHGGSTVEGQLKIAEKWGVTEQTMGVPIKATMEVVRLGTTASGVPVHMDRYAYESDALIVMHRVTCHRHVMGPHQSGFLKMLTIGLGKQIGAATVHAFGWEMFPQNLIDVTSLALEKAPIILGLALVENGFSNTAIIEAVKPEELIERDTALLQRALEMRPRIPFDKIDLLVVQEMGKNLPPDTDIVGRPIMKYYKETIKPDPTRTVVLDLHDDSMGNAANMAVFDFATQRFFKKIDFRTTAINVISGNGAETAKMPVLLDSDRLAIEAGLKTAGFPDVEGVRDVNEAKIVLFKNTRKMEVMYVSECLLREIEDQEKIEVIGGPFELPFDPEGNLTVDFS